MQHVKNAEDVKVEPNTALDALENINFDIQPHQTAQVTDQPHLEIDTREDAAIVGKAEDLTQEQQGPEIAAISTMASLQAPQQTDRDDSARKAEDAEFDAETE